jgi:hypothetical protein
LGLIALVALVGFRTVRHMILTAQTDREVVSIPVPPDLFSGSEERRNARLREQVSRMSAVQEAQSGAAVPSSPATVAAADAGTAFAACPERLRSVDAITDIPPESVLSFARDVQRAIGRRDAAAVARVARFPLLVLEEPTGESRVRNARELTRRFDQIFDPAVSGRLASAGACTLEAVADEGFYYGRTLNFSEREPGRLQLEEIWRREPN